MYIIFICVKICHFVGWFKKKKYKTYYQRLQISLISGPFTWLATLIAVYKLIKRNSLMLFSKLGARFIIL